MEIWSRNKDCRRLPNFLVIGPQKTGTTALYRFLQLHPAIESNFNSDKTFEELQFFSNSDFYSQGNLLKSIDNCSRGDLICGTSSLKGPGQHYQ
mgnify:CR=1 FL=1